MVSAETLYAVLVENTEEGPVVQFTLSSAEMGGMNEDMPFTEPGETTGTQDEDDVTIQFGDDGGGGGDMFMESEFDDVEGEDDDLGGVGPSTGSKNFQAELDDLLDECAERGYEDPEIAFCSTTEEVDQVELRLPPDESTEQSETERGLPLPTSRSELLEMLEEQYKGGVEDERVGFVPMHRTGDGRQRVLALIARPDSPVLSTLSAMEEQTLARTPQARLLDTEISLYMGLARSALQLPPDTPERTILVRSGPNDTLVLFIEGNSLRQSEYLPELTAEASAETICSRVLLLQDEYGMGEVQHIMLVAEENEGVLSDAFKSYFASANLRLLRTHLPGGEKIDTSAHTAATGAALRLLDDPDYEPFFQTLNLLPNHYTASRFRLPVGGSVPILLGLLAVTTLGFVWYYFTNARSIADQRSELRTLEREVAQVDQQALQRRIDSVQSAAAQYSEGLGLVRRLLKGSNKWSKEMAAATAQVNSIDGLSISEWDPVSDTEVSVTGRSVARPRVVQLAQRLDGEINTLTSAEVRDVSLYNFEITVPLDTTKPEAVDYWRTERLAEASVSTPSDAPREDSTAPPSADAPQTASTVDNKSTPEEKEATDGDNTSSSPSSPPPPPTNEKSAAAEAWTVVIASMAKKQAAQQIAQTYRDRLSEVDHSVQVRYSSERDRYRVGVGTFSSFEDGRSMLKERNERFPKGAWLHEYTSSREKASNASEASQDTTRES